MDLLQTLRIIPAAIIGLTVHEFSHAYIASLLGDNTAKEQGRITLNPLKHIDWLGFFLIIIAGFGWAKPVSFNPQNLKHKHRDEILISLAGPFSNLLLAIFFFIVARSLFNLDYFHFTDTGLICVNLLILWGIINLGLFIFNLIPLPPLDGSHIYLTYLSAINPRLMVQLYKYGTMGLLGIIIAENYFNLNILHLSDMIHSVAALILNLLNF